MIAAGLLTFFAQWRTIVRAMRGLGRGAQGGYATAEVPGAWFLGLGLFGTVGGAAARPHAISAFPGTWDCWRCS